MMNREIAQSAVEAAMIVVGQQDHERSIVLMKFLSKVARRLNVAKNVYIVGGAVRDFYIDRPIKDLDIVIDSVAAGRDSDWFAKQLIRAIPAQTKLVTNQYGVAILAVKGKWMLDGFDFKGEQIEIANARKEWYGEEGGKGYKPHDVEPATIKEDICRREFTYNCLLWSLYDVASGPDKTKILDLTGCGIKDLKEGLLRCPVDPNKTFSDDPTRMLRAIKFAVRYDHKLTPDTVKAIQRNAQLLKQVPQNAIAKLIMMLLSQPKYKKSLALMQKLGLLDVIADLIKTDRSFRSTLSNWIKDKRVIFMFDVMHIGLPLGTSVKFLSQDQQKRLYEIALTMKEGDASKLVAILKQPGKVLDSESIIEEFGLKGSKRIVITEIAREELLKDPSLVKDQRRLTKLVRQRLAS